MNFFQSLYRSCYDLLWLKTARLRGVGKAWGYFFLFMWVTALVVFVPLAVAFPKAAQKITSAFEERVPDFTATVASGELSVTGIKQPLIYKTTDLQEGVGPSFVIVVDTVSTNTKRLSSYLEAGESGILVNKESLEMYQASRDQSRIQYWNKVENGTITKADVSALIAKGLNTKTYILFGFIFFIFLYIGIVIGKLFGLLIISLIVFVIANIAKRRIAYGDLFITGLYAVTLPIIISSVLALVGVTFGNFYLLALLAFLLAIVFTKDPSVAPPVAPTTPNEPKV